MEGRNEKKMTVKKKRVFRQREKAQAESPSWERLWYHQPYTKGCVQAVDDKPHQTLAEPLRVLPFKWRVK